MAVCSFVGNTDMYGLGIRIGFYLQWYAGDLASWLAPSEVKGIRLTNSIFIAATFLALLIQIILNVSNLQVVEVYIILLLTFGYFLFFVPLYTWRLLTGYNPALDPFRFPHVWPGQVYSVLNFLLLVAVASFQLWFWFARVPQLDGQACQEYGFFFAKIKLNAKGFEVLNIAFYFLLLSSCAIVLSMTVLIKAGLMVEKRTPRLRYGASVWPHSAPVSCKAELSSRRMHVESLQKLRSACNVAVASTVLTATELTIKWNKIQGVNSLSSAGQTIPLLIGIAAIVRIVYVRLSEGPPRPYQDSHRGSSSTEDDVYEGPRGPRPVSVTAFPRGHTPRVRRPASAAIAVGVAAVAEERRDRRAQAS